MDTYSGEGLPAARSDVGIVMATAARRYDEWIKPGTETPVKLKYGLLLPIGYDISQEHPDRPWICPMRDCRVLASTLQGLAYHFKTAHKHLRLNDNGDGTFSEVGTHEGSSSIVASRNPLSPNAPPMAAPCLPRGLPIEFETGRKSVRAPKVTQTGASPAVENVPSNPSPDIRDPNGLWAHICAVLRQELPVPDGAGHKVLLQQPFQRSLKISDAHEFDLSKRHALSLLIQITGMVRGKPCSDCRRGGAPFHSCVSLPDPVAGKAFVDRPSQKYSCACCFFRKQAPTCSVKGSGPKLTPAQKPTSKVKTAVSTHSGSSTQPGTANAEEGYLGGGDDEDDNDVPPARRGDNLLRSIAAQKRQRRPGGQFLPRNANKAFSRTTNNEEPPAKRRAVTINVFNGTSTFASSSKSLEASTLASAATRKGKAKEVAIPSVGRAAVIPAQTGQTSFGMESWEVNGGQVTSANSQSGLLASRMSLGQSLQLTTNVSLTSTVITSGSANTFAADTTKARACVVLSGKVKVNVDGEAQFTVGPHGVFRIAPGMGCSVQNHFYVDATMQITTVTGV